MLDPEGTDSAAGRDAQTGSGAGEGGPQTGSGAGAGGAAVQPRGTEEGTGPGAHGEVQRHGNRAQPRPPGERQTERAQF